ncbi:MAG: hypothetical protein ACK5W7_09040 [Gemmatimonadaceae bacterium]|jgi:hypothetical protein
MLLALLTATVAACVNDGRSVKLTFRNNSDRSIPLQIPRVMNPNLSPMSNSGVTLEGGQAIFFKYRGKKTLLLRICDEKPGEVVLIDEVIARRTVELDAERARRDV